MCRARLAVEDYFRRVRVCNVTAAESTAVTADCVTSEVAASERERASGLEMQFLPVCTVAVPGACTML